MNYSDSAQKIKEVCISKGLLRFDEEECSLWEPAIRVRFNNAKAFWQHMFSFSSGNLFGYLILTNMNVWVFNDVQQLKIPIETMWTVSVKEGLFYPFLEIFVRDGETHRFTFFDASQQVVRRLTEEAVKKITDLAIAPVKTKTQIEQEKKAKEDAEELEKARKKAARKAKKEARDRERKEEEARRAKEAEEFAERMRRESEKTRADLLDKHYRRYVIREKAEGHVPPRLTKEEYDEGFFSPWLEEQEEKEKERYDAECRQWEQEQREKEREDEKRREKEEQERQSHLADKMEEENAQRLARRDEILAMIEREALDAKSRILFSRREMDADENRNLAEFWYSSTKSALLRRYGKELAAICKG